MHINTFDHYQTRESLIHSLDPRVKVVVTILFILSNVLLLDGAWLALGLSWGLLLLSSVLARLRLVFLITRSWVALPFALAAVTVIFSTPGDALTRIGVGSWLLTVTDAGFVRFLSILLRSWLSVQMAILLTATTQFPDLIHALRHLRVPKIIVSTISFMYRYLFVLSDEAMRLMRARTARSAQALSQNSRPGGSVRWRAKVAGGMSGQLFLRSYERSERVYNAMLSRGYRGEYLTLNPHDMRWVDWAVASVALLTLLLIQIVGHLLTY
ncbi:MAG: cobalt ECF transporter T component CbiQ [Anaerolineales bacterium]|jgi:cobalt/nickel transport system permease protein